MDCADQGASGMMQYHVMTLFPEMICAATQHSILKRAQEEGKISISTYNIRDFAQNKHRKVDDYPYGGGAGMVMAAEPIVLCHRFIQSQISGNSLTVYLSPKGEVLRQTMAEPLLKYDHLILLCGHYEGIDQRVIDMIVDREISIGDYILTGGEIPAVVLIEMTARLVDGVLGQAQSHQDESFSTSLLEYPQYTRPQEFEGLLVPEILLSGDHARIAQWRHEESMRVTQQRRPDLLNS